MNIKNTPIKDLKIIEPAIYGDHRGWFMESYNYNRFTESSLNYNFVQDNHSFSKNKNTLRGLHFQDLPKAQSKLVRCTSGKVFDVAVDLRRESLTYKKWFGLELSAENKKQLLIPKGFAHGFLTLTEDVQIEYKVDEFYNYSSDRSIKWDDSELNIHWPIDGEPVISEKDLKAPFLKDIKINF